MIDLRIHQKIGSGVYADVFVVDFKAYKLFKAGPEVPPRQTKAGRRRVFESQCEAFRLASNDLWLRNHVATLHGCCVIEDVLDGMGTSIGAEYLLDCCYVLEQIGPGEIDFKVTAEWVVAQGGAHLQEAFERFERIGVSVLDSSVFYYDDPERFKFIDIEMRDCN